MTFTIEERKIIQESLQVNIKEHITICQDDLESVPNNLEYIEQIVEIMRKVSFI